MSGFTKLFSTITESSLWSESKDVRILWVAMLAKADAHGVVEAAVPGLARMANLTLDETKAALDVLMAPDPYSKNPENDGRRVEQCKDGFVILNYGTYRQKRDDEQRREYMREYMRNRRNADPVNNSVNNVNSCKPQLAQAEAEAEAEAYTISKASAKADGDRKGKAAQVGIKQRPTDEQAQAQGAKIGLPQVEVQKFLDFYDSKGWLVGKAPMKDWRKAMSGWRTRWQERNQPQGRDKRNYLTREEEESLFLRSVMNEKEIKLDANT